MATITTRAGKGSPLTNTELDNNFTNLNTAKYESGDNISVTGVALDNATYLSAEDSNGTNTRLFGINSGNSTYIGPIDSYVGGPVYYGAASGVSEHRFYVNAQDKFSVTATNVVVNESSADVDFRVESDSNASALFVNGQNSAVVVGSTTNHSAGGTAAGLTVHNGMNVDTNAGQNPLVVSRDGGEDQSLAVWTDDSTAIFSHTQDESAGGNFRFQRTNSTRTDANYMLMSDTAGIVINEDSLDTDFRVESDTKAHALSVDGLYGNVGIGGSPHSSHNLRVQENGDTEATIVVSNSSATANATAALRLDPEGNNFAIINYPDAGTEDNLTRFISTASGSAFKFATASADRMTIHANGRVDLNGPDYTYASADNNYHIKLEENNHHAYISNINGTMFLGSGGRYYGGNLRSLDTGETAYAAVSISNYVGFSVYGSTGHTAGQVNATTALHHRLETTTGAAMFNDTGASTGDFRVESDTNANMLFVDAGDSRVGVGTASPSTELTVSGSINTVGAWDGGSYYTPYEIPSTSVATNSARYITLCRTGSSGRYITGTIYGARSTASSATRAQEYKVSVAINSSGAIQHANVTQTGLVPGNMVEVKTFTYSGVTYIGLYIGNTGSSAYPYGYYFEGYASATGDLKTVDDSLVSSAAGYYATFGYTGIRNQGFTVYNGGTVLNQDGTSTGDFRVESDTFSTALFVDAADGTVNFASGIIGRSVTDNFTLNGKNQPHYGFNLDPAAGTPIGISGYYGISLASQGSERVRISQTGSIQTFDSNGGQFVVNEGSATSDFRVESDGQSQMLFVDGGDNEVHINGDYGGGGKLNVTGEIRQKSYSQERFHQRFIDPRNVGDGTYAGYLLLVPSHNNPGVTTESIKMLFGEFYATRASASGGNSWGVVKTDISIGYNGESVNLTHKTGSNGYFRYLSKVTYGGETYYALKFNSGGGGPHHGIFFSGVARGFDDNFLFMARDAEVTVVTEEAHHPKHMIDNNGRHLLNGGLILNEIGEDKDFRVESDSNDHMLFVDAGSNEVGIGTSNPTARLDVDGTGSFSTARTFSAGSGGARLLVEQINASVQARFSRTNNVDTTYVTEVGSDSSGFHIWPGGYSSTASNDFGFVGGETVMNQSGSNIDFRIEGDSVAAVLFVDANLDAVYINGAQPSHTDVLLDITGRVNHHNIYADSPTGGYATAVLKNTATSGTRRLIDFRQGTNTTIGSITHNGTGTTYATTSDRRLKDNIEPIADGTAKLMAMKPVTHTWIADPEADAVHGFIAQEMQEIVPEAVSGDPDGEEMMSMDYGRITPVLVAALQEATNEIKALKQRVSELEAS